MKIIDDNLINGVAAEAKQSPRLRMNYNFHQSLSDKCHRFLNALEPGTQIPIHHHPTKDETFVILKGKVRVQPIMMMVNCWSLVFSATRKDVMALIFPRTYGMELSA